MASVKFSQVLRRSICQPEFEFLRAVREYFPSLQAHPNYPLSNFIDVGKIEAADACT